MTEKILTKEEWEEEYFPEVLVDGARMANIRNDGKITTFERLDGTFLIIANEELPNHKINFWIKLDPRYTYDMNRTRLEIKPEYRGTEHWKPNPDYKKIALRILKKENENRRTS
jgi:hypothetical protein